MPLRRAGRLSLRSGGCRCCHRMLPAHLWASPAPSLRPSARCHSHATRHPHRRAGAPARRVQRRRRSRRTRAHAARAPFRAAKGRTDRGRRPVPQLGRGRRGRRPCPASPNRARCELPAAPSAPSRGTGKGLREPAVGRGPRSSRHARAVLPGQRHILGLGTRLHGVIWISVSTPAAPAGRLV